MKSLIQGKGNGAFMRLHRGSARHCRHDLEHDPDDSTFVSLDDEELVEEAEIFYYCAACRHRITSARMVIEVKGSHTHYYANPFGNVFGIGCFAAAPGVVNKGTPTLENTWFAGYSWCYSFCGGCLSHLGWQYLSQFDAGSFFGLILDGMIRE